MHLASDHIAESMRKVAEQGELSLRTTLQQKRLQRGSVVAVTGDITTYPRAVGPFTLLPL